VGARHHHDDLVGDQDDDSARCPGVGGSWRAGCVLAGRHVLAGVRSQRQAGIEVRRLLSHTSGVSGWEPPFAHEYVYDWEWSTSLLAAQAPWWEPGSASGHHDTSYGHLVGEVVRRITGASIAKFFADEIAGPLGADSQIGLPKEDFPRVSNIVFPGSPFPEDPVPLDPDSVPAKTFGPPFDKVAAAATDAWRHAEIPAGNGHGNARSVARIQPIISNGGEVDGVRLLSPNGEGHRRERPRPADDLRLCDEQDGRELTRRLRH
jgi:CubicO group peptidase (beta-lactamase class C family)